MFRSLLTRLFNEDDAPAPIRVEDAELAIAALLVRVARADDGYRRVEKERIERFIAARGNLDPAAAADRLAVAEMLEAEAPDTVRFTRAIKQRIPLEHRAGLISGMWSVALADGYGSAEEEAMVRLTAGLLGVSDVASAQARRASFNTLANGAAGS